MKHGTFTDRFLSALRQAGEERTFDVALAVAMVKTGRTFHYRVGRFNQSRRRIYICHACSAVVAADNPRRRPQERSLAAAELHGRTCAVWAELDEKASRILVTDLNDLQQWAVVLDNALEQGVFA